MNLNQLHYFSKLAKAEHYTKAAEELGISQPSLSHAIGSLEQELGTKLFEKQGRNVVLTKYGKIFREYVDETLRTLDAGVKKVRTLTGQTEGLSALPSEIHRRSSRGSRTSGLTSDSAPWRSGRAGSISRRSA